MAIILVINLVIEMKDERLKFFGRTKQTIHVEIKGEHFMKHIRKFSALFLSLLMVTTLATTAFAVETTVKNDVPMVELSVTEDGVITAQPRSGNILGAGNANFYGDGTLDVFLDSGRSGAYIQAGTGGSSARGTVNVSVRFPNGLWYDLGLISTNADHTTMRKFGTCPSGTYHFLFENSTDDWIQVYARIYD